MKIVLTLLLTLFVGSANAGFLLGYAVGTSGKKTEIHGDAQVIISDKTDVITCNKAHFEQKCIVVGMKDLTPAEYTTYSGYKFLHRVGVVISANGEVFIVMEVSK